MKRATAYIRSNTFVIHASSRTSDGVWILTEPCIRLPTNCSDEQLGNAVLSALGGPEDGVTPPSQWRGLLDPLLNAAGVKSWKTFAKSASCVEIEQNANSLVLIPTINLGPDEGYQASEQKTELSLPANGDTIGARLRDVFLQTN